MSDEYKDIRGDGSIVLYLNKGGSVKIPKWQARIRIRGVSGYRRQSLKTSDFAEAKVRTVELYDDLNFAVKSGQSLNPHLFSKVFIEYDLTESNSKKMKLIKNIGQGLLRGCLCMPFPFLETSALITSKPAISWII